MPRGVYDRKRAGTSGATKMAHYDADRPAITVKLPAIVAQSLAKEAFQQRRSTANLITHIIYLYLETAGYELPQE